MSDDIAIKVDNVSKTFRLPHEKNNSIKGMVINFYRSNRTYEKQEALKDVSFKVKKGEFFGIVGRNGSGKSTLLKMLAGIYSPSRGNITVNGKLTPFIELGVGFNPELTGRENVFLNGALLGFNRKEMRAMYRDIVEFAELRKFMDQKLKNYSSGMQVRLAFSIAIRAKSDILILDEVLAVGDTNFQKKCSDYFERIKNANKTIVLVTHDMTAVERFCDKAMVIDNGKLLYQGEPAEITKRYSDLSVAAQAESLQTKTPKKKTNEPITIQASIMGQYGPTTTITNKDKKVVLSCDINSKSNIPKVVFGAVISSGSGTPIFATNTKVGKYDLSLKKGKPINLRIEVDNIFANGEYTIAAGIKNHDQTEILYANSNAAKFVVGGRDHDFAVVNPGYKIETHPTE